MSLSDTGSALALPLMRGEAPHAVGALYATHAGELRRYARRIVGSADAAEDVVQEVFLRLWVARARVELGGNVRAYLFVSARARALDALSRAQRERAAVHDEPRDAPREPEPAADAGIAPPAAADVRSALERVLAGMPPRQRAVATLRLCDRLSTAEVARRLVVSPRTVEAHVARALRRLRAELPALLGSDPEAMTPR